MASEYENLKKEIAEKVKAAGGVRHSKSDLTDMTYTLLNTPDHEVKTYIKGDVASPVSSKPVERYRDSLKPVLKQFGVDAAEMDKIQDVKFSKEHAEALNDVAQTVIKDYTGVGRKLILPINDTDESQMEIYQDTRKESVIDTTKIVKNDDGSYSTVPTGKRKTTKEHKEMKVSNKVPGWLVSEKQI